MGVASADFIGQLQDGRQRRGLDSRGSPRLGERGENGFCGDVANQVVTGKGATAKTGERAVKPPAAGFARRANFLRGALGAAVEMDSQTDPSDGLCDGTV